MKTNTVTVLLKYLKQDTEFKPYLNILDEVVGNLELNDYLLDKKYLDISYVIIDDKIINLDEIYFLCKDYNS